MYGSSYTWIRDSHSACRTVRASNEFVDGRSSCLCLHILSGVPGLDLKRCELVAFGDNSSKELKNNSVLRLLGGLVQTHKIKRSELRTLESGHSHEDLDEGPAPGAATAAKSAAPVAATKAILAAKPTVQAWAGKGWQPHGKHCGGEPSNMWCDQMRAVHDLWHPHVAPCLVSAPVVAQGRPQA